MADPDRGRLLFANASLAFKEAGVDLSPEIADHVLHTVRQSAAATTRRERLTAQLKKALGVGSTPVRSGVVGQHALRQARADPAGDDGTRRCLPTGASRPRSRTGCARTCHQRPGHDCRREGSTTPRKIPWRLDLDADVPALPSARTAPSTVALDELWFYLDAHELVRPLLELGILEVSVLPTLTRTQYEAVKAGKPTGGFLDWVDSVTFPEERVRPARASNTAKTAAKKAAPARTTAKKADPVKNATAAKTAPAKGAAAAKTAGEEVRPGEEDGCREDREDRPCEDGCCREEGHPGQKKATPVKKAAAAKTAAKKTGARPARPR